MGSFEGITKKNNRQKNENNPPRPSQKKCHRESPYLFLTPTRHLTCCSLASNTKKLEKNIIYNSINLYNMHEIVSPVSCHIN